MPQNSLALAVIAVEFIPSLSLRDHATPASISLFYSAAAERVDRWTDLLGD